MNKKVVGLLAVAAVSSFSFVGSVAYAETAPTSCVTAGGNTIPLTAKSSVMRGEDGSCVPKPKPVVVDPAKVEAVNVKIADANVKLEAAKKVLKKYQGIAAKIASYEA